MKKKCEWCISHELSEIYHDTEWGVPVHDDTKLFEYLVLDAFQAGLSWLTAFDNFDYKKIAKYNEKKVARLLDDAGIIRNKLKIRATITNAKAFIEIQKEFGSFDSYIWQFVNGKTIQNKWRTMKEIPAKTKESDAMSADLKKRGFKFTGTTICYAFMQAAGLVNDHVVDCFRYKEVQR